MLHSSAFCTTFRPLLMAEDGTSCPHQAVIGKVPKLLQAPEICIYLNLSRGMSMALPSILWGVNIHGPGPNTNKAGRRTTSISSHSHMDCPDIGKGVGELSSPYTAMFKHFWSAGKGCPKKTIRMVLKCPESVLKHSPKWTPLFSVSDPWGAV